MSVTPRRVTNIDEGRRERLDAQLQDLERRLQALQLEYEKFRGLEQKLLDSSAARIHDFERRLEHEWLALRQLHEEALPAMAPREVLTPAHAKRSRLLAILAASALALTAAFTVHTRWSLGADVGDTAARVGDAEGRLTKLQALVQTQTKDTQQNVQRLTADALTAGARAERLANVLAAPDMRQYPLRSPLGSASADGQVFFSPTRGVALTGSKVPVPSSNQVYQVWMTTTRGPISLGFVSPDAQGRMGAGYDAPPGVSGSVIGFMLTVEPVGGSAKPTGPLALGS